MKPRLPNSPTRLALLSALGALVPSAFLVQWRPLHHSRLFDAYLLLGFAVFAAGAIFSLKCTSNLRHGVENRNWPESQIKPLRNHLKSPWYTALTLTLIIACGLFEFVFKKNLGGEGWVCLLLGQTISQLRIAVRPPPTEPSNLPTPWRDHLTPLRSDHWGQR